jgi:pimeloyl-ACP methyl ester carboxylesterase
MPIIETSGARLSYARAGDGPVVLFVQGVGIVGEGWRPQIDALKSDFTCLSFDNRGIGSSVILGPHALSVESMADDAMAILDCERIDRFHLVGHSLGGVIAQEIALRAASRVRSLSLLCTFARGKQGARLTWDILVAGLKSKIGTSLPASSRLPGPTAMISPCIGFSCAVSGMMIPPLVFVSSSTRRTTTRSWRGRNFMVSSLWAKVPGSRASAVRARLVRSMFF